MDSDLVGLQASSFYEITQARHCGRGAQGGVFFSQERG